MILADTNIIIEYLKNNYPEFDELIDKNNIATCGIILAELLHGIKSKREKKLISEALNDLHWIEINDDIWIDVGENLNICRRNGLSIPFQDAVIATLCINNKISILSNDKHFKQIKKLLPDLKIYNKRK